MNDPNISFPVALLQIPGFWENERTKDTWYFKPLKGNGYAAMEIIQANTGIRITYAYKTIIENKILYLEIDNKYFQVMEISIVDSVMLKIKTPSNQIIILYKNK